MSVKKLRLAPDVLLPVEVTTRRTAIFGMSGSGKSNTATRVIELLLDAGEQVVLVDPKGEGWGLQTSADGKSAGYDVIVFGRPRGDVPELREEHAEQVADFVVDTGRSVVLSLLGFSDDAGERRFVTRFCKRLYRRKSQADVKTRTLVVLEEAHLFVPEQASGASADMVGAIKRIGRQGRSAGLGLMLVDQRPQDVAKSVISQCELLVVHQLAHKLDRDALRDWVKAYDRDGKGEAFLASLAELRPGEAWAWSPAWLRLFVRTKVERRRTYDSGATPDGSPADAPKARAKVDLEALKSTLAKVVEDVKANDPAELKRQCAELRKQLAAADAKQAAKGGAADAAAVGQLKQQIAQADRTAAALRKGLVDAVKVIAEINARGFDKTAVDAEQIKKAVEAATGQIVKIVEENLGRRNAEFEKLKREATTLLAKLQKLLSDEDLNVSVSVRHNEPFTVAAATKPRAAS